VIRFNCPHCGRAFLLPDALARLPLLCKGCGQRVIAPEPQADATPAPETVPDPPPPKPKTTVFGPPSTVDEQTPPDKQVTTELHPLPPPPEGQIDLFPEGEPKAAPPAPRAAAPAPPPGPRGGRKLLPTVVDVAVGLILIAVGVFGAETFLKKSTGKVLADASGPRFPSTDLVIWAGLPLALVLIYVALANRGMSLGGWLRRKSR
jgi:hypothetical protein